MSVYHGGDVWQGSAPGEYLDFSANLNPEGPPEWVRAAMLKGLENARYYPDLRQGAALAGLSAHLGLPEACILPTAGGIEAIACAAGLSERHAVAQPTFQEYGALCGAHRDVRRAELADYRPQPGETLWLCNPNNPTGDALSRGEVLALLEKLEAVGGRLAVDEAFIDYCPAHSVRDAVSEHPALIVLGSLTKVLAIPGVRLGYMAAHPTVIEALRQRGILVRPCGMFPGLTHGHVRLCVRTEGENAKFIGAMI